MLILKRRTDDAQDITHFRSGVSHISVTRFSVADLVHRVADDFQARASLLGVHLSVEVEQGLPPLTADERRLEQVLHHFIRNALEYASSGKRVAVRARQGEQSIVLEVQDYGPGIDPGRKMSILQSGYREDQRSSRGPEGGSEPCNRRTTLRL